jgi:hypothetical protein
MIRSAAALLGLLLLVSCRSFEFERQQMHLRYDPATDVLEAILVFEGVGAAKSAPAEIQKTTEVLTAIGRGRRRLLLLDWPIDFDLDQLASEPEPEGELERGFLAYQTGIRVLDARFVLDDTNGLCLIQRIEVRDVAAGLRLLDAALNAETLGNLARPEGESYGGVLADPITRERMRARAESQGSWVRFDGATLVMTVPATPEQGAMHLRELAADDREHPWEAFVLDSLTSVQLDAGELRLAFAPAADGWIRFAFADGERRPHPIDADRLVPPGTAKLDLEAEVARLKALR